jgi:integrase/recombinase XerD
MKLRFDEVAEQDLRKAFIRALDGTRASANQVRSCIRCACLAFREEFPGDSLLNHTHSTEWVRPWNARQARCSFGMRLNRLQALGGWWQWLFECRVIDDNVFKFVSCVQLARDTAPLLILRCNLHRYIAAYLQSRSDLSIRSRQSDGSWLMRFNLFINRRPEILGDTTKLELGEEVLGAWFRSVCIAGRPRAAVVRSAGTLSTFLDYLVSCGVLAENVLKRLSEAFPVGKRVGVAYALAADDQSMALHALTRPPEFRSSLADHIAAFLDLKRAAGCTERYGRSILRDFDRFLVAQGEQGPITSMLLARWGSSRPGLGPVSRRQRWILIRQFCLYLRRYLPETWVPDSLLGRFPPSRFRPRIVQPEEITKLLAAVAIVVPGSRWALRPVIYRTLLVLLYSTGLRISEALELQVGDIDLHERVITIRQTKFYKSRLVPFSDGLLTFLRDYQRERLRLVGAPARNAAFFPTKDGGHYTQSAVNYVWQDLLKHADLRGSAVRGPRVHDLRHSFATLRLAVWYHEGVDVEAMLPRLATYLGHAKVASTYLYLTMLPETLLAASERFRHYGGSLIAPTGGTHALA